MVFRLRKYYILQQNENLIPITPFTCWSEKFDIHDFISIYSQNRLGVDEVTILDFTGSISSPHCSKELKLFGTMLNMAEVRKLMVAGSFIAVSSPQILATN